MNRSITMNRESIKASQDELLGHVQRMAAMDEVELRRMATEVASAEEKAATSGKGLNFFNAPSTLRARKRKRFANRIIDSFQEDEDMRREYEWERAKKRGSKFIIQDPKAHF